MHCRRIIAPRINGQNWAKQGSHKRSSVAISLLHATLLFHLPTRSISGAHNARIISGTRFFAPRCRVMFLPLRGIFRLSLLLRAVIVCLAINPSRVEMANQRHERKLVFHLFFQWKFLKLSDYYKQT